MAEKKNTTVPTTKEQKYKGSQLLRMDKYNNLFARTVIKPDESYSFNEADGLISNLKKKKG